MMYFDPSQMMTGGGGWGGGWPAFNGGFMGMGNFGGGFQPPMMSAWNRAYFPGQMQGMAGPAVEPQTPGYQPQVDKLKNRIGSLQSRAATAEPAQAAKIQQRIGTLEGRVQNRQANAAQPMPQPSYFGGMQAYNPMAMSTAAYRPQAQSAPQQGGGAQNPGSGFGPRQGGPPSFYEAGMYNTPFGQLVQSNSGNGNLAKLNNNDDGRQFYFDPNKGWNVASQEQLNAGNFANPYDYAQQAGASQGQFIQKNGMWQLKPGTGVYA